MKTYLNVPYEQKEQAKRLGARFDMGRKSWYVPDGVDLLPFLQWAPGVPKLSRAVRDELARWSRR